MASAQPCLADVGLRPSRADDVLVEVFPRPDPEEETARHEGGGGGGGLGHHGRMNAKAGTRHGRSQPEPARGVRDSSDHAPHEWALALPVDPGVIVIRDEREREPALLRSLCVLDQGQRRLLFAR